MDVPNLDDMEPNELQAFSVGAQALGRYAALLSIAKRCRLNGHITEALRYEALCDQLYKQLPEGWRW